MIQTLRRAISFILFIGVLSACTKDRIPEVGEAPLPNEPIGTDPNVTTPVQRYYLFINEFVARGSENVNEFGSAEDWIEVFNPSFSDVTLTGGRWYISDAGPENPTKYQLPEITIPARGFLLIWADNMDTVANDIHTNFRLSAAGEHIIIWYIDDMGNGINVDDYLYGQQEPAISEGRFPDGGAAWTFFNAPTPGAPNM